MAYNLVTKSFGSNLANAPIRILEVSTGVPAIIMQSETGGVISTDGRTFTDGSGNLAVYIDTAKGWNISIDDNYSSGSQPTPSFGGGQLSSGVVGTVGSNIVDAMIIHTNTPPDVNDGRPEGAIYFYSPS